MNHIGLLCFSRLIKVNISFKWQKTCQLTRVFLVVTKASKAGKCIGVLHRIRSDGGKTQVFSLPVIWMANQKTALKKYNCRFDLNVTWSEVITMPLLWMSGWENEFFWLDYLFLQTNWLINSLYSKKPMISGSVRQDLKMQVSVSSWIINVTKKKKQ